MTNYPFGVHDRLVLALSDPCVDEFWDLVEGDQGYAEGTVQWPDRLPEAFFELAVAWGQARLFGVPLAAEEPEEDWFSVVEALAAECVIMKELDRLFGAARKLPEMWNPSSFELGEDLACEVLEQRHAFWGIEQAILHGLQKDIALVEGDNGAIPEFHRVNDLLKAVVEQLAEIDAMLLDRVQQQILCTIVELPLLHNYRAWLVEPFSDSLPWWLDGTLEAVDQVL